MEKELLPSFVSEQEEWLEGWLSALGWGKDTLQEQVSEYQWMYITDSEGA